MKLKRILFALVALGCSSWAIAQTTLPPNITGINDSAKNQILQVGIERFTRNDGLVATASGTLANSAVLTAGMNIVATVASSGDSFTLPTLTGAVQISIVNGTATSLNVFPNCSTCKIDNGSNGAAKALAGNKMMNIQQGADGLWYTTTSP